MLAAALIVYVAGAVVGLLRVDAAPLTRLAVALLWPVGVAAAAVTGSVLVLSTMVLFPKLGAPILVVAVLMWWIL